MNQTCNNTILQDVEKYYSERFRRHGATALGVDWHSPMSQRLRFVQLLKLIDWSHPSLSLHDLGCGYGALLDHLEDRHPGAAVSYLGTDLSRTMINAARQRWAGRDATASFECSSQALPQADYTVASGIFNVCVGHPLDAWEQYVSSTLREMRDASKMGFAVNFISPEVGLLRPETRDQLYTASSLAWSDYCTKDLHCNVQILCGYGLNEFTLLARIRS